MMADPFHLTQREQEVAELLAEGLTYEGIGRRLGISHRTVAIHAGQLRKKTDARTNVAAVVRVRARGHGPRSATPAQ